MKNLRMHFYIFCSSFFSQFINVLKYGTTFCTQVIQLIYNFGEDVYTCNFIPALSMVKYLLLFMRFYRDKISSRDSWLSKRLGWNFIPGWKMKKKTFKHFICDEHLQWLSFFNLWRIYSCILSKVNVFEHNESLNIMNHKTS